MNGIIEVQFDFIRHASDVIRHACGREFVLYHDPVLAHGTIHCPYCGGEVMAHIWEGEYEPPMAGLAARIWPRRERNT